MQRERFTWNARVGLKALRAGTISMPTIDDERPAGRVMEVIEALEQLGAIKAPEGYRLTLINDDETDITGLVINVHAEGTTWPAASDGWSEIDNYLPALDDEQDKETHFEEMVSMVLGRADRCLAFLQDVQRAFAKREATQDERAIELANMLGEFWVECRSEGMSLEAVQMMTIRELVTDVHTNVAGATLSNNARILLND
jgi:hypothetical protein